MIYRRRRPKLEVERERNAEAVAALCRTGRKGAPSKSRRRWVDQAEQFRQSGDWSQAGPEHLVALYVQLHEWCYGVPAVEVAGEIWLAARSSAAKMVREEFGANVERAVEFMRWAWRREADREKWRREHGQPGARITWRQQFQRRSMVTDYRLELERRQGATAKA